MTNLSACNCTGEIHLQQSANKIFSRYFCDNCTASTAWYPTQAEAAAAWERLQGTGELTIADYEEALADHRRLVRELDREMNGDGAAPQASLCDLLGQVRARNALSSRPADGAKELLAGEWPGGFTINKDQTFEQMVESIREGVRKALSAATPKEQARED